ncbi:hypothetical protein [Amycolatopsis sp. NPDC051903]|uniref:hypothetical protein n=1 Tax=Amycolatopsis sp. NPDC051903 TaxID=3363936 RepID=UPI0037A190DA
MSSRSGSAGGRYAGRDELDQAVARLWQAARERHAELPATPAAINARYPNEPFPATAAAVTTSILREAVRELADARELTVTSRGGRYHNRTFRELAAEIGLSAEGDSTQARGFAELTLTPETADTYRDEIETIRAVLDAHPLPKPEPAPRRTTESGAKLLAQCACPRKIYAAAATLAGADIVCTTCRQPFRHQPTNTPRPTPTNALDSVKKHR